MLPCLGNSKSQACLLFRVYSICRALIRPVLVDHMGGASSIERPFTKGNPKLQAFLRECQDACLAEIDTATVEIWLNEMITTNRSSASAWRLGVTYSNLIRKVHCDFNDKIFELLRHAYLNRHDEVTTFDNICRRMGYKTVPKKKLLKWLEKFYESKHKTGIHPEYQHLIRSILEMRALFERSSYNSWAECRCLFT